MPADFDSHAIVFGCHAWRLALGTEFGGYTDAGHTLDRGDLAGVSDPICGFDGLLLAGKKRTQLGDFFHQLHHRYFECNYGTVEMPWDKWFGTFHDGSEEATVRTRAFKKQMYTK
jgi:hypothetical protein